ncbi:MAG: FadD3 family acyl-CoA ligase [Ilumatobacteraceae bacterium]
MDRPDLTYGTIPRMVRGAAQNFADLEAVVDGETRWTFAELSDRVDHAGRAAMAAGLRRGETFSVWAPNRANWIVAALGGLAAGGVLVPLNTRYKAAEAADILVRSRAKMLFTVTDFLGNDYVEQLLDHDVELPDLTRIVVLDGTSDRTSDRRVVPWADHLAAADDVARDELDRIVTEQDASDISDVFYTSGTTGRPKGVMTTHAQTLRVFWTWADTTGVTRGDRYLMVNPFFHTFGYKAGVLASLMKGATIHPALVFDVPTVLQRIQDEAITVFPGSPTVYLSIMNDPAVADYDLSSLRLAVTGAAAIPVEMIHRMRSDLTFDVIVTAYGLSESTGTISICRPDDPPETIATTSGRPIPGIEVAIVDDDGAEVPRGTPGEIVCRGYNVMVGYLDDPEATAETITPDGWLHTGDIGVMDADGYIAITDRKKDMFNVGGFNAYPAEIENVVLGHPAVAQVAVVGVPEPRLGEVGHAYVVPRHGATVDPDELVAWCRERMANYKVPRAVHVVDSLPMNAAGKVLKHVLRSN